MVSPANNRCILVIEEMQMQEKTLAGAKDVFSGIALVVLDFDGTLADTRDDIVTGVNLALEDLGLPRRPCPEIAGFIGRGVEHLARQSLPPDRSDLLPRMLERFRIRYRECYDRTSRPYPGVAAGLQRLQHRGYTLAVASNKPSFYLDQLLDAFGLAALFSVVLGGDGMTRKKPHPWCIEEIHRRCGGTPGDTLMVGDMRYDMETGRNAGTRTCGVLHGYGTADELARYGADALVDDFTGLVAGLG